MHGSDLEEEHCQCINCRLARMEKQIAMMQNNFETLIKIQEPKTEIEH